MSFHIIIPARYASSRFPGKPLMEINGKAMVCHVVDRARESQAESVTVATDDQRILDCVQEYGADAILTSSDHPSGTDRLEEAARLLQLDDSDILVNVQGDEPLIDPRVINQVATNLMQHPQSSVATLCEAIETEQDLFNPNIVKVAFSAQGQALYFSRSVVPWDRDAFANKDQSKRSPGKLHCRHLGIYGYKVGALKAFVQWPIGQLENLEKLEQLRFLENGHRIHIEKACVAGAPGVDTPEDLERVKLQLSRR